MSAAAEKRLRREFLAMLDERERMRKRDREHQTQIALEEIDDCQNRIDCLNEKASEDILKVELKYNKMRKPFFEKRNRIVQKIDNFWITAFVNHPLITGLLDEDEEDCLHNLTKLEVEEFEDIKFGYRIKFFFKPNKYFDNEVLIKECHLGAPVPCSKSTTIRWKEGQNILQLIKERNKKNQKQGKKRTPERRTFFTWYEDDCDPTTDEIAEVIKDDLWTNPLQYYLVPDVEVDAANGAEDDGGDDAMDDDEGDDDYDDGSDDLNNSEEDGDDTVVVVEEVDEEMNDDEDLEDEEVDIEEVVLIPDDDNSQEGTSGLTVERGSADEEVETPASEPSAFKENQPPAPAGGRNTE